MVNAMNLIAATLLIYMLPISLAETQTQTKPPFRWPEGKTIALSLSWDDARPSQVDAGLAVLDRYGVKATFYVVPSSVEKRLDGWKRAVAAGHEIGNHTMNHPCSGNFAFAKKHALEEYDLRMIRREMTDANRRIKELLGVMPESFAYPCGQKFVGRGVKTKSYVPEVAKLSLSGRGWMDEGPNDPFFCDFAQLTGMEMDGKEFDQILPILEKAKESGAWVVLGGHEIGLSGVQTTRVAMLEKLFRYAQDPGNGIWLAPVSTVAHYVRDHR